MEGFKPPLNGHGFHGAESQIRSDITAGLQPGPERSRLVRDNLCALGVDLASSVEASAHGDWAGALKTARMIHGRAVVARRALEGMLGAYPDAADLPPIVRAVQAVGQIISDREVDRLAPDELRARMRAVLRELDRELQAFLGVPDEPPIP
jgi:hypothetical protein